MECSRRWTYADGENGRWGVAVKCNFFRIRIIHYALPHIMYSCRFKCSSGHTGDVLKNVDRLKDFSAKGVIAYFQVPYKPQVRKLVTLKSRLVPCWCITSYRGTLHFPIRYFSNYVLPDKCNIFLFFREVCLLWKRCAYLIYDEYLVFFHPSALRDFILLWNMPVKNQSADKLTWDFVYIFLVIDILILFMALT